MDANDQLTLVEGILDSIPHTNKALNVKHSVLEHRAKVESTTENVEYAVAIFFKIFGTF